MTALMNWVSSQAQSLQFVPQALTRVPVAEINLPDFWKSPSINKLLTANFPVDFGPKLPLDPNLTTVLGGMCLLNAIDMKRISRKEITFASAHDFEDWYSNWYPRIDQIHDAVGIPPNTCHNVIYTVEDSFFADRLSSYTGLDKNDLQSVLQNIHGKQGHPVLKRYLKCLGYKGKISVKYTSEVEAELELALRIWERLLGMTFRTCDRNFAKVELMYTGFWLDILGLKSSAIIYEAASKMILKGWLKLNDWFTVQEYGKGVNQNLGIAGYLPFITPNGDSSVIRCDEVPNYSNFETFNISENDIPWYVVNLLFMKKSVVDNGPLSMTNGKALELIRSDLLQYYRD